ncbi:MAG: radical SAM protein [Candidatus Omnitrophota bacterium]
MKIVLTRPNFKADMVMPVIGLGYLSSFLKLNGIETRVIDGLAERCDIQELVERIVAERPDAVGIHCFTCFYKEVIALSKALKGRGIPCIIGGPHPTFLPYRTLIDSGADYVVCGEGEKALTALLKNGLINNGIRGVYSPGDLKSEADPFMKAEVIENLDDIPFPDWEELDPCRYPRVPHGFLTRDHPVGRIMTTRGCPYHCVFCGSPKFYDSRLRYRSAENVIGEIRYLMERFKAREIHFFDDNLTFDKEHIMEICRLIIKNGIKIRWCVPDGIRADRVDEEMLRAMKESGCYYVLLGIESADPEMLKDMKKGETIEQMRRAIRLCDKAGINVGGTFIFGLPGETKNSIDMTIRFARSEPLIKADFLILDVLPGSELWDRFSGKFEPDWDKGSYREPELIPEGLSREELLRARSEAFRRFYFRIRPRIFIKILRMLRPYHIKFIFKKILEYRPVRDLKNG